MPAPSIPRRWIKRTLIAVAIVAAAVLGALVVHSIPVSHRYFTDADQIREPASSARTRDILWQPARKLDEIINTVADDYEPRLSADGLTLFFVRGKAGGGADIYTATHTPQGWTEPQPLKDVNSDYDDLGPEPSADGESLYLYSDRPGGAGGYDLWVARRGPIDWQTPTNLGNTVNSEFNDYGPAITSDGGTLYFSSNRPQPDDADTPNPNAWPATLREDLYHRHYDIYLTVLDDRGYGAVQPVTALNTPYNEGSPAITPFSDFLYFSSDRPDGQGGYDLYRCRRLNGEHTSLAGLGPAVNTTANELDPGMALGGYALYFSSDRTPTGDQTTPTTVRWVDREYNLYYTTSREVFAETERLHRPPINWAALWSRIGPNLFWALLALLLLLLLLALLRPLPDGRMSLLTKCLLASLMAHLLLMLLFNVWEVTAAIAGEFRRGGRIQVALTSSSTSGELFSQIRGSLTAVEAPSFPEITDARQTPTLEMPVAQPSQTALEIDRHTLRADERLEWNASLTDAAPPTPTLPIQVSTPVMDVAMPPTPLVLLPAASAQARIAEASMDQSFSFPDRTTSPRAAPSATSPKFTARPAKLSPPSSGADRANGLTSTSLADSPPTTDANAPSLSFSKASIFPQAPTDMPTSREIVVTALPVERAPDHAEIEPTFTVPTAADSTMHSPRVQVATHTSPNVVPFRLHRAQPVSSADVRAQSLAPTSSLTITDAAAPNLAPTLAAANTRDVTPSPHSLASIEITLPALSSTPDLSFAEPESIRPRPTFAGLADVARAALTPSIAPSPSRPRTPTFTPLTGPATAMSERSLAAVPPNESDLRNPIAPTVAFAFSTEPRSPTNPQNLDLPLPVETAPPRNPYVQRTAEDRLSIVKRMGGSEDTEKAVAAALRWLATHQSSDGRWDGETFDESCGGCGGETSTEADRALTGLALLAFLGAGNTHSADGPYRETVERGIRFLLNRQSDDGDLRGEETMYSHGIAAIALSEAYGMTRDATLAAPIRKAAAFIDQARNRRVGGWRYDPGQAGDTSVLGWQVMALKSAHLNGIPVAAESFQAAREWLETVADTSDPGRYSYKPGRKPSVSMTAEGMFVQQLLGRRRDEPRMQSSASFILRSLPDWKKRPNTYAWYYATLALYQHQGDEWRRWNEAMTRELLAHQRKDGPPAGSWDPDGEWADVGGRVYQTALGALMLEIYYRYLPMYSIEPRTDTAGVLQGLITDASSGLPLPGTTIRVDLAGGDPVIATAGPDGRYELRVAEVPDFFATSATHDGFVPASRNVDAAMLRSGGVTLDFALQPESDAVVAVEAIPEVHHLGDNRFDGTINSQFQKRSEGKEYSAEFTLKGSQVPPYVSNAEVQLLAKGVQRRHRIRINGTTLDKRLSEAPDDGSFGEFAASFDPAILQEGTNAIEIIAAPSDSDIDDFEFVNVRIGLTP